MTIPIGLYLRSTTGRHPRVIAAQCARHGVDFVAISGPWQMERYHRDWVNDIERIAELAQAFGEVGIEVWLTGYVIPDKAELFVEQMLDAHDACGGLCRRWLIDTEIEFRGATKATVERTIYPLFIASAERGAAITLSTYGRLPGDFPIGVFSDWVDSVSGQVYTLTRPKIHTEIRAWRERVPDLEIIMSAGAYHRPGPRRLPKARTAEELHDHLDAHRTAGVELAGIIVWAENFVNTGNAWAGLS